MGKDGSRKRIFCNFYTFIKQQLHTKQSLVHITCFTPILESALDKTFKNAKIHLLEEGSIIKIDNQQFESFEVDMNYIS